jgi:hypothetical protein
MVDLDHWKIKETFPYLWIYCPIMDGEIESFKVKRKIYKELKAIEEYIKSTQPWHYPKLLGWMASTDLKHTHIMKFFAKWGAKPFEVKLIDEKIWFYKKI